MTRSPAKRGLVERVRRLVTGAPAEAHAPKAMPAPAIDRQAPVGSQVPVGGCVPSVAGAFEDRLSALLRQQSTVSAGRLQIIGLERIRERLGSKWDRYHGRVHDLVEATLRQRLSAVDVCTRLADLAYVVVFAELTEKEAVVKCSIIQREIEVALFGEDADANGLSVAAAVACLDSRALPENGEVIDAIDKILDDKDARNSRQQPKADDERPDPASLRVEQDEPADGSEAGGLPDGPDLAELFRPPDLSTIGFRFCPIWHVKHNALLGFLCVPVHLLKTGDIAMGYKILGHGRTHDRALDLDLRVLAKTVNELRLLESKGQRILIACQVNFQTLRHTEAKRTIIQCCRQLSGTLRHLLVFEVTAVPDGVPVSVVQEIDMTLRGLCRHVTWHTALKEKQFGRIVEAGAKRVALDIDAQRPDEAYRLGLLGQFAVRGRGVALRTIVHGIHTTSLATSAVCSGFDEISGNAISPMVEKIHPGYEYTPLHVVAHLLASSNRSP
jgi:hypothetical protein